MALTSKFKNILFVVKQTRLMRFDSKGVSMNPYVEKIHKHSLNQNHKEHHGVLDEFVKVAKNMDKKVTVKYDHEVTE
jgi:hypothetical protein